MDPTQHPAPHESMPPMHPPGDMIPVIAPHESIPIPMPSSGIPAPVVPVTPHIPAAQPVMPALDPMASGALPVTSAPAVADDLDLIEKEWVEKAKSIVAATRNDPYAQNDQINKFKADYMKKRYGKDVKTEA